LDSLLCSHSLTAVSRTSKVFVPTSLFSPTAFFLDTKDLTYENDFYE
jgi:hypothetical protein